MLLVPDLRIPSLGTRLPAGLSGRRQSQDPADALRVLAGGSRIIDLWDSRNRFLFRKNKVELPVDVQQQLVVGLGGDQHNRSLGGLRAIAFDFGDQFGEHPMHTAKHQRRAETVAARRRRQSEPIAFPHGFDIGGGVGR